MKTLGKSLRYLAPVCVALVVGTLAAFCVQSVAGTAIVLAAIASIAAAVAIVVLHRARDAGDTGEVMHDLSVPISVAGKHWGAFRIGYRSRQPLVADATAQA